MTRQSLAAGPGYVLLSALERGALCAGIDFSSSMLALAQRNIDAASKARKEAGADVCTSKPGCHDYRDCRWIVTLALAEKRFDTKNLPVDNISVTVVCCTCYRRGWA